MENTESRRRNGASGATLTEAIRRARVKEALELDEVAGIRSAEFARLEVLKAELERIFEDIPAADERFELVLMASTPARLWIDMFSYVTVDAASHAYRLIRNGRRGRRVLAETEDVGDMRDTVTDYIAEQIVLRERQIEGLIEPRPRIPAVPAGNRLTSARRAGLVAAAFAVGALAGIVGVYMLDVFRPLF